MRDDLVIIEGNIELGVVVGSEITYGWKMIQELGNNDYDLIILKRSKTILDKVLRRAKIDSLEQKEGRKHTEESKIKMSVSKKGKQAGENNPFYGKHHTEETKEIIRRKRLAYLEAKNG